MSEEEKIEDDLESMDGESNDLIGSKEDSSEERQQEEREAHEETTDVEDDQEAVTDSEKSQKIDDVSDRLELLIPNVLDTAEATNAAADVTVKAASALEQGLDRLHERADVLTEASKRSTVLSTRILVGSITALILSAFIYAFMAYQLASRTSQIDAMLLAVGKRIVKMNSALATFEDIKISLGKLADEQKSFETAQSSVLDAVEKAEKTVLELQKSVPEKAAERIGKNTDKVAIQINKLKQKVDGHTSEAAKFNKVVTELSRRMVNFEKKLSNVKSLNLDVAALVKLERERYLEALRKKAAIEEAQLRSQVEAEELVDPSIIKYPKKVSASNES